MVRGYAAIITPDLPGICWQYNHSETAALV